MSATVLDGSAFCGKTVGRHSFVHSSLAAEMLFFTLLIGRKIIFYRPKLYCSKFLEIMSFRVSRNYFHLDFRGQIYEPMN